MDAEPKTPTVAGKTLLLPMYSLRMRFVLIASLLLTATVVLLSAYNATAHRKPITMIAAQAKARILVTKTHLKLPLKIAVVKTQKGEIETDKEFVGNDD